MFVDDADTQFFEIADALNVDEAKQMLEQLRSKLNEIQPGGDNNASGWILLHIALVIIGQRNYEGVLEMLTDAGERFTAVANDVGLGCVTLAVSICKLVVDDRRTHCVCGRGMNHAKHITGMTNPHASPPGKACRQAAG